MNNSLLIANTMEKELAKIKDDRKIHDRLIDNLNHASSVDGVFYLDLDQKEAVIYRTGSRRYFRLPMVISTVWWEALRANIPLPSPRIGVPKLTPQEWAKAELFWTERTKGGKWFLMITVCIMS